jgi:hypothetical protein
MTEPTSIQPAPAPGLFARFIGVLTAPRATFEKIVPNPTVFGALAIVALTAAVVSTIFMNTEVGRAAFTEAMQQRASANTQMSPEQLQRMEQIAPYIRAFSGAAPLIFVPIAMMVISAVLFVVFNVLMGGTATFRQMMSVVSHSQFVSVVGTIVMYTINYMRGTMTGATNLSAFLPNVDEHSFVFHLARTLDLFLIWWLIVLAIGLAVLYRRKTGSVAVTLFSIYGVIAVLIAFIASR